MNTVTATVTATATSPATPAAFNREALEKLLSASAAPVSIHQRQRAAWDRFAALGMPQRSDENWMRTDLRLFKPQGFGLRPRPAADAAVPPGLLAESFAAGTAEGPSERLAGRVLSLDGHILRDELDPDLARQGVLFGAPERLLAEHGDLLQAHWLSVIDSGSDWFGALHAAFHSGGAILYVPPGVHVTAPLHLLSAITPGGVDTGHVLVVLGDGAEATLLTETAGGGLAGSHTAGFHCGGTELVVGKGAMLRMVNLQNWNTGVWHFARQKARVHAEGRLQWTLGALGSRLSQVQQDVALVGRGAHAQVNGVMFTEGRQQLVYNTLQHHQAPDCKSDLLYKGALQDRSRLVWRGMIKVDKIAQKTDGYQRNDNLMLSTEARADSIPGLEIEADDVRCTHGSTSGRVDDEQIFYAQARGLTADEAARLVVAGFFQQVFDRITIPPVREALARAIGGRIRRVT